MRRSGVHGRRSLVGVAGGFVLAVLLVSPAAAQHRANQQQPREGVTLEVDAGYGGSYLAGRRLPVHVTVRTDRLVRGSLEVTVPEQPGSWGIEIEVPGGGVNDFVVVVPTPASVELNRLRVRLVGAGASITADADIEALASDELVGLLPEVTPPDVPEPLDLAIDAGTARFEALDPDEIAVNGVLDPIGTIVAGPDELGRLSSEARASVLDWVDRGGRLVVDATPGTNLAGLPDEWQPGDAPRRAAGLGEVRFAAGAAAAGRWADVVEPTPTASNADLMNLGGINVAQFEAVSDAVARDAGLSALELPWLLAFLAGYVAIVGPISWFVLRRRRAALGWVVIPAVAALFTAASFVVGSDLRAGTTAAHGTVLETGPAGSRATTILGLVSRNGRDGEGDFPSGWTAGGVDNGFWTGQFTTASNLTVRTSGDGVDATVPLAAGGFAILRGSGPVDDEGGLVVEAHSDGDAVSGTIRNTLPFAVEDVGVILGRATHAIGRIEAGETADFSLEGAELNRGDPYQPPEARLWPGESGYNGNPQVDSVVNLALWNDNHMALGPNARTRGIVTVVGWTRSFDAPGDVPGESDPDGRSAIVGRAPVDSPDGSVALGSAHRELVRSPDGVELPDADAPVRVGGAIWRFALPAGAGAGELRLDVPAYIARADVWNGTEWAPVDDQLANANNFNGDIGAVRSVALGQVPDGVVWVRGWMLLDWGGFDGAGLDVEGVAA